MHFKDISTEVQVKTNEQRLVKYIWKEAIQPEGREK
jgi:hypothetical protein